MLVGQRYRDGRVMIGIVDYGCGLKSSLSKQHEVTDDKSAIIKSMKPGVSGNIPSPGSEATWENSGFGLFVLSELGKKCGYFSLMSGKKMVRLYSNQQPIFLDSNHSGTAVNIIFHKPHGHNLVELCDKIIAYGEKTAKADGYHKRASKSSKMSSSPIEDK